MRTLLRRTGLATLISIGALVLASAAVAAPMHVYGELLTSTELGGGLADVRAQLDVGFDMNADTILLDGDIVHGDGIGSGYVSSKTSVTYEHRFNPSAIVGDIIGAGLFITTLDDGWFDGNESVAITLDDQFWAAGQATFQVFDGWVSASLFEDDEELVVSVTSTGGDTVVIGSLFKVLYEEAPAGSSGGGISAVPEPGAMALFCAGLGVVGVAKRRRS